MIAWHGPFQLLHLCMAMKPILSVAYHMKHILSVAVIKYIMLYFNGEQSREFAGVWSISCFHALIVAFMESES